MPEGTNRVKQFSPPRFLFGLFILTLLFCATFFYWIIQDYQRISPQFHLLGQLQKENERQRTQIDHLTGRINQMGQKVGELKELDIMLKAIVNLETNDDNTEFQGVGGSDSNPFRSDCSKVKTDKALVRLIHLSEDNLSNEATLSNQDRMEFDKFLENQKIFLFSTPSIWPTKGLLSSRFGYRISPLTGEREFHIGVDISTRKNAPIVAPADGIVSSIHRNHWSGEVLCISHGYGFFTRYIHLQKALVKKGQFVKLGETIALVGDAGRSTGPHLHYEVHMNGVPVNPLRFVRN